LELPQTKSKTFLEFSKPTSFPIKQLYRLYFHQLLPVIGRLISKDKRAYSYLPESVEEFPVGDEFIKLLQTIGYRNVKVTSLMFGIAAIYFSEK